MHETAYTDHVVRHADRFRNAAMVRDCRQPVAIELDGPCIHCGYPTESRPVCDDCRQPYAGPVYYTLGLDPSDPEDHSILEQAHDAGESCTDNLCPACAGPYLSPDTEGDPRRPVDDTPDAGAGPYDGPDAL